MKKSKAEVMSNWRAVCKVYGNDGEALDAVRRNQQVLQPFVTRASGIEGVYKVLVDMFGKAEAAELIRKNPGVLTCNPKSLAETSPEEIVKAANFVVWFDALPTGVKDAIPFLTALGLAGIVGGRIIACGGGQCAADWDLKGGLGVQLLNAVQGLAS